MQYPMAADPIETFVTERRLGNVGLNKVASPAMPQVLTGSINGVAQINADDFRAAVMRNLGKTILAAA